MDKLKPCRSSEEWRTIHGFDGRYEVSSHGRVRNRKGHILAQGEKKAKYTSYKRVCLSLKGETKIFFVHRLVAQAFLDNPGHLPMVNHKDENGENNFVENLEWCTRTYNAWYGTSREKIRKFATGRHGHNNVPVSQISLSGELIANYPSQRTAAKAVGGHQTAISSACRGRMKTAYGYRWERVRTNE